MPLAEYDRVIGKGWFMKLEAYLKKLAAQTAPVGKKGAPADPAFQARCPLLYALMTDRDAGNNRERSLSKVSIWVEPVGFKASVSLPDEALSAYVTHNALETILDALEAHLNSSAPDVWRPWGGNFKKKKRS